MANLEDYSREICETRRAIHRRPEEGWTELFQRLKSTGFLRLRRAVM